MPSTTNDDQEIFDGMSLDERPLSQPTIMSFTLQSIRLAELSRRIVDRNPLAMAHNGGLSLDSIMDIDAELQGIMNEIPRFYSMSTATLMQTYGMSQTQADSTAVDGKMLHARLSLYRCKLHLPYHRQALTDSSFSTSRDICIKYARLFIASELWQEDLGHSGPIRLSFASLLIGLFVTCVILLLDVATNPTSPLFEDEKQDTEIALQIIQKAQAESRSTLEVLDILARILQKHNKQQMFPGRFREDEPARGVSGIQNIQGLQSPVQGMRVQKASHSLSQPG